MKFRLIFLSIYEYYELYLSLRIFVCVVDIEVKCPMIHDGLAVSY